MTAIRKHLGDFVALIVLVADRHRRRRLHHVHQESRPRDPARRGEAVRAEGRVLATPRPCIPGQGQSVRVAGVKVGLISKVTLKEGQAVVERRASSKKYVEGPRRCSTDTTALLRPRTGLKDMFIELEPGTPRRAARGERHDPGREHRAGHRPGRVPVGARLRHALLPPAADQRRRQGPRRAAATTCARSSAASARPTAASRR